MQRFGNANKATSLTKQDWAILATTADFKFCVVAFYMIGLITMLKELGFDLKQLSWFYLLGGMEMAKFIVSPLIERYRLKRIGQFRGWLCLSSLIIFICPIYVAFHPTATGFYTAYGGVCAIEPKQSIFRLCNARINLCHPAF